MSLVTGTRFGVYEVLELIGAGGMGEVYRARDTKLQRDVALKSLPELFAADPERLARFKREAQVLASLNHPHIASIYGFEEAGGAHALILELVPGPTLGDRTAQGAVPLDEALPAARQIADALEAAHAQGIVHRDLKPANIKIRPDGTVKVLDFGLARAIDADPAAAAAAQTPTITSPAMTQRGIILGTAAYMSPEQARGKTVDKRSDIWAFGAVLYEMLAGKRAFEGEEISDTLANILKDQPDWKALPPNTPAAIRRLLRRCLEKDPKRRLHDISDARLELTETESVDRPAATIAPSIAGRERLAWGILVVSLTGFLAYALLNDRISTEVVRFQVGAPDNAAFGSNVGAGRAEGTSGAALAPDGTQIVFVSTDRTGATQLWLRRFDAFASRRLDGTENGMMPFWSPDSRSMGFFSGSKLKRLDLASGSIQTICDVATPPRGGTWGSLDQIVFSAGTPPKFVRVPARGGAGVPIASIDGPMPIWPSFLTDGRHFLYWAPVPSTESRGLFIGSTDPGSVPKHIVASDSNGTAVSGFLIYAQGEALVRQAFDADRFEVTGEPTPIADLVLRAGVGRADFTVSESGVLAYRAGVSLPNQFAWFDRSGKFIETVGPPGNYRTPDLSPDRTRLAFTDVNARDIWILDLVRGTSSRFTSGPSSETAPAWFPDGKKIAYRTDQGGLFEKDVTGTSTERHLTSGPTLGPSQVSPDGKWIFYFAFVKDRGADIFVVPTAGSRTPQAVITTPFSEVEPQLSPDGRWLAYASSETGRNEIYVQPFPTTGTRWQVSNAGGRQPVWRKDGKELFFVADDAKFYAVDIVDKPDRFDFGVPHFLFDMRANVFNALKSYIPSPDGQRFLINMLRETADAPINVVHNWTAEIKK
jgi:Tol biopolymer transport system component